MTRDEFIALCKEKIKLYINSNLEYDIYTVWCDYWTVGDMSDSYQSLENHRGIFGETLNNKLYDMTYSASAGKLHLNEYAIDASTDYTVTPSNQSNS